MLIYVINFEIMCKVTWIFVFHLPYCEIIRRKLTQILVRKVTVIFVRTWLIWSVAQNLRNTPLLPKSFRDEGGRPLSLVIILKLRHKHSRFRGRQVSQATARSLVVGGEPNLPFYMHECFKLSKLNSKVCQAWRLITTTTQSWVSNPQNLWQILMPIWVTTIILS